MHTQRHTSHNYSARIWKEVKSFSLKTTGSFVEDSTGRLKPPGKYVKYHCYCWRVYSHLCESMITLRTEIPWLFLEFLTPSPINSRDSHSRNVQLVLLLHRFSQPGIENIQEGQLHHREGVHRLIVHRKWLLLSQCVILRDYSFHSLGFLIWGHLTQQHHWAEISL